MLLLITPVLRHGVDRRWQEYLVANVGYTVGLPGIAWIPELPGGQRQSLDHMVATVALGLHGDQRGI